MKTKLMTWLALFLSLSTLVGAQSGTLTIPLGIEMKLPIEALKGEKGDKGEPGIAGVSEEGNFTPILGGVNGESDQVYSSQQGSYKVMGGICYVRVYIQFADAGTINGQIALKNLPKPVSRRFKTQIFGGTVTYFSNPRPDAPILLVLRAGGGNTFAVVDGIWHDGGSPYSGAVNPKTGAAMTAEHVLNGLTQFVASFDYFVD